MNVELIKIDPTVAREKLSSYRKALAARAHSAAAERVTREYEKIAAGYEAAAKGLPLIMLTQAMRMGGWDEKGRPRFAVCRADQERVECSIYGAALRFRSPGLRDRTHLARFDFNLRELTPRGAQGDFWKIMAIVPMVPPDALPRLDANLSRRVILWEADWSAPPVDPMLLLPIGGDLYAVEAAWDLTPLERAVIAGRANS